MKNRKKLFTHLFLLLSTLFTRATLEAVVYKVSVEHDESGLAYVQTDEGDTLYILSGNPDPRALHTISLDDTNAEQANDLEIIRSKAPHALINSPTHSATSSRISTSLPSSATTKTSARGLRATSKVARMEGATAPRTTRPAEDTEDEDDDAKEHKKPLRRRAFEGHTTSSRKSSTPRSLASMHTYSRDSDDDTEEAIHEEETSRPRSSFFKDAMGITEVEFLKLSPLQRKSLFKEKFPQYKRAWTNPTLEESEQKISHMPKSDKKGLGNGSLHVIVGENPLENPLVYEKLDIGNLQARLGAECNARQKNLSIVVASNSNALETTSKDDTVGGITVLEKNKIKLANGTIEHIGEDANIRGLLSYYIHDNTQGPAAAISAVAGLIDRMYFGIEFLMDDNQNLDPSLWSQNKNCQINIHDALTKPTETITGLAGLTTSNGYLQIPHEIITINNSFETFANFFNDNKNKIGVGVHRNIPVSFGLRTNNNHLQLPQDKQVLINQIFCAALDIGQGTNPRNQWTEIIAKTMLNAQIRTAIIEAWAAQSDTLILPLLGCGAFGNDPLWVIEALNQNLDLIRQSGLKIILNLFSNDDLYRTSPPNEINALRDRFQNDLKKLVRKLNGTYTYYKQKDQSLVEESLSLDVKTLVAACRSSNRAPYNEANIELQKFGHNARQAAIVNPTTSNLQPSSAARIDQSIRLAVTGHENGDFKYVNGAKLHAGKWPLVGSAGNKKSDYEYVIHIVGPNNTQLWTADANAKNHFLLRLKQSINTALSAALRNIPKTNEKLTHIAIPLLSSRSFDEDDNEGREKALVFFQETIAEWLAENQDSHDLEEIRIVVFSGEECAICMDASSNDTGNLVSTPCKHNFHKNCLAQAKAIKNECPICRKSLA